jgi:uncharacterized protein (DUF1800 family)
MSIDLAHAWAPFEPTPRDPWDLARVAHLHRRAGFAASWRVLQRDWRDGPSTSIDRLLDGEPQTADGTPAAEFAALMDAMADQFATAGTLRPAQGVWLYRMIFTPHPLRERMTLFWHNHFATSNIKVNNPSLMRRQNDLLRQHALGDFRALLDAIGKDPAMLLWLDASTNRKAHPNENYAREVMELFTLGRGHYTEKDVQQAARAFTGWCVVRDRFSKISSQHDDGPKTILGQTGPFQGEDVTRILLEQPACAEFLCGKLIRHFLNEIDPIEPDLIAPLAKAFRESGYQIRVPVELILRSRLFHDPSMRRRRVKSPVEFTVGAIRALEVLKPTVSAEALAEACQQMGQSLFEPPSVAGWDGGPAWINTTTTLARTNFALRLLSDRDARFGKRLDPKALAEKYNGSGADEVARFYLDLLIQDGLAPKVRKRVLAEAVKAGEAAAREAATLILTAPEYQLS